MIVPSTENHYSGILCYSASKDVHVVVFHGPPSPEDLAVVSLPNVPFTLSYAHKS